MNKGNTIK